MALTELAIKHLKPKSTVYRIADSGGLCLEVSPSGSKLWRWRYYYQGKEQMLALGKYPALTLADARKKRDEARELVDAGKHPTREKKIQKLRKAHEGANIFEKIARRWFDTKQPSLNERYHMVPSPATCRLIKRIWTIWVLVRRKSSRTRKQTFQIVQFGN